MSDRPHNYSWPLSDADRADINRAVTRERAEAFQKMGRTIASWFASAFRSQRSARGTVADACSKTQATPDVRAAWRLG
jgi:rare lipoprotein A (peptidoglycan hydrolase)